MSSEQATSDMPAPPPLAGGMKDETSEPVLRDTHFDFSNKVFKVPKARFYKPDDFEVPVFVVDLGDLQGELRLKNLIKTFNIEEGTRDFELLSIAVDALKYVEDVRPGDRIPGEILDGTASWTVSPKHKLLAKNRLEAQLIAWLSGEESKMTSTEELNKFLAERENKAKLREAFNKAAIALGLKEGDTTAVLLRLELLARELCYIEALREAFQAVPAIARRFKQVSETYAGDLRVMDTVERVRALLRKGVREYQDIFLELDAQTGEIISTLKTIDNQIALIREKRDKLRYLQMKWTPLVRDWSALVINQGARVQDLLGRTYRFLATRFDTSKSLMKARKEQEEAQRMAQEKNARRTRSQRKSSKAKEIAVTAPRSQPLPLPIDELIEPLRTTLAVGGNAVVTAAPGAGKTTRIPLRLMDEAWLAGKTILMLEPRRLAARMAAERMAQEIGEAAGERVGYRVRLESKVSARTRVEVVTEGILNRRLQHDPELAKVGVLIFDEFHERNLDSDLGLALALDVQRGLRPDLRIVVMSATLDAAPVAAVLGQASVFDSAHRPHPVETRFASKSPAGPLDKDMAALIRQALREEDGSVLAFLPGEAEIRRVADNLLQGALPDHVDVRPLYGALSWGDQNAAVAPSPAGRRKVVLATTIAETSLTIDGVRVVVDCGLKRVSRFDPARGMSQLVTVNVSRASAEQRRGRAGRLGPGVCYRLWTEAEDRALAAYDAPEIATADLAPLALDLANWGVADPKALPWLTPPPDAAFRQGVDLLRELNAVDAEGRITAEGRAMAALPLHPRLAHVVHRGAALGAGAKACDLAALLAERDILVGTRDPDLRTRLDVLARDAETMDAVRVNRGAVQRVREASRQIRALAKIPATTDPTVSPGVLTALAYPDRIAQRRGGQGRFRMAGGGGAVVDEREPLAAQDFLAIAQLDGAAREARVFMAAPITRAEIEDVFAEQIQPCDTLAWDSQAEAVTASRQTKLGALVLTEKPLPQPNPDDVTAAFLTGVRAMGLGALPWTDGARALQQRVAFARKHDTQGEWPDMSDDGLAATLETWLAPFVVGFMRRAHLSRLDVYEALKAVLSWDQVKRLDAWAPTHIDVPSGSSIRVDYSGSGGPSIAVKLQEVFGLTQTPMVGNATVPVTLHLLSPGQKPIAVTADLASFWKNVYPSVRGEMRGRYPRHIWPEDPLTATAVRKSIKPRGT